jgi:hypothetical protein
MSGPLEYAIRRLNWRRAHDGLVRMPGCVAVGALPTHEEAETDRARREAGVRARVGNPFLCGPSHAARSRMPEAIFCDWLREVGIEPLQAGQKQPVNWSGWWEQAKPRLAPEQVAHVWAGLDRVRFFEVAARAEGSVGYAVVRVDWEYNDNWMEPGDEGGRPLKVFRRWAAAEAYRGEREDALRAQRAPAAEDDHTLQYETTRWTEEEFWPVGSPFNQYSDPEKMSFVHGGRAPYYEIVEIDLPGLVGGWNG